MSIKKGGCIHLLNYTVPSIILRYWVSRRTKLFHDEMDNHSQGVSHKLVIFHLWIASEEI